MDVYLRDIVAETTTLVSRMSGANGAVADRGAAGASVSDNGRCGLVRLDVGEPEHDDLDRPSMGSQ